MERRQLQDAPHDEEPRSRYEELGVKQFSDIWGPLLFVGITVMVLGIVCAAFPHGCGDKTAIAGEDASGNNTANQAAEAAGKDAE